MQGPIEILAPAGSRDSLSAALRAGADAVYFGAGKLNLRSMSSASFSLADLRHLTRTIQGNKVKAYLTLNAVLYEEDLPHMAAALDMAAESGVDAVIANDPAAILAARERGITVHISTQMNIANFPNLKFWSRYADAIVLARELNLHQMASLAKAIQEEDLRGPSGKHVRLEVFVHGAMCLAVSGKCQLSQHLHQSSANRGACLQPCRRTYLLKDSETGEELEADNHFLLSPQDLKTIGFLDKIISAGAGILKIEGRGRKPEYVQTTVKCYKEAVNSIREGTFSREKVAEWDRQLAEVFQRGFWDGYYLGRTVPEWTDAIGSKATLKRVYSGICINYYARSKAAEFRIEDAALIEGSEILITGPTTGALRIKAENLRSNDLPVSEAGKGSETTFLVPQKVRRGDRLYLLRQENLF